MVEKLGRLHRVDDLKSIWTHEAKDFTPWLQNNIDLLAEALGLDIQLIEREVSVGSFFVDLLGEEARSGRPVVIENQLDLSDHSHLGQLLTYSAGKNGGVIIWVAKKIKPEHRQALNWLNDATQGNIDFYGIEIQLLKIGNSNIAPDFNVVVSPKSVPPENGATQTRSEKGRRYHEFFSDLLQRIKAHPGKVTQQSKVGDKSWLLTPSGRGGFRFGLAFYQGQRFGIELYVDQGVKEANKRAYDELVQSREQIEEELGHRLDWQRLDDKKACRISWHWSQHVTVMDSNEKLNQLKEWAVPNYFKFRQAMSQPLDNLPQLRELTAGMSDEDQAAPGNGPLG